SGNSTFTVAAASGYAIPTTGQISNWNTAYGWGDFRDYGLDANPITINSLVDFNQIDRGTSWIRTSSAANSPFRGSGAALHVKYNDTRAAQLWFSHTGNNQPLQYRITSGTGVWGSVRT